MLEAPTLKANKGTGLVAGGGFGDDDDDDDDDVGYAGGRFDANDDFM